MTSDGHHFVSVVYIWCLHFFAEDLTVQRDALIDEIQSLKLQHVKDVERLNTDAQEKHKALEERMERERKEEIERGEKK